MRNDTNLTVEGLFAAVQPHVRLEVARAGEALVADLTLVRLLARVHEVVLLQVRQLRERLRADAALERPFARVCAQMNLQVGQLAEVLVAEVALVLDATVALLQRKRKRLVAPPTLERDVSAQWRESLLGRQRWRQFVVLVQSERLGGFWAVFEQVPVLVERGDRCVLLEQ